MPRMRESRSEAHGCASRRRTGCGSESRVRWRKTLVWGVALLLLAGYGMARLETEALVYVSATAGLRQ